MLTNFESFISDGTGSLKDTQNDLIETLSIMQHHDAITGTHTTPRSEL